MSKDTTSMRVTMPVDGYRAVSNLADRKRKAISEIVREALELYLKSEGVEMEIRVQRGGDRRIKADE